MNRLRQVSLPLLAAVCLAGLPACGSNDAEREAKQAGNKAEKAGKKAEKKVKKAKKEVDGYYGTVMTADELTRATATSLHDEFATIVSTRDIVGA